MENILYYGDNLNILRNSIADKSIDLIYLDPPFNSKADYNILFKEATGEQSQAQITAFGDTWHWTEETGMAFNDIVNTSPVEVVEMMRAFKQFVGLNDLMAYLTMMCVRLVELKRILKDSGSIYLHCDPTASHYLKILMDTIFDKKNFRNEICWCYRGAGYPKKDFGRRHDIILRYSLTSEHIFYLDDVREQYADTTKERFKHYIGNIRKGKDFGVQSLHPLGKQPDDWWQIQPIAPSANERLGYPTQKPEALLERIIKASSNEGDIILDPFCGCGTTIAVAQKLKRNWIGIDITHLAINLIKWRLKDMFSLEPKKDYNVIGEPEDLSGARELALHNRYQFQWWALSLIDGRPYRDKKKGADTGIDGYIYFTDEKDKTKSAIVQVKSGKVGVKDIRDLGYVIDREKSDIGIFITLEIPTQPMIKEALSKGYYKSIGFSKDYPRIQILTIDELLSGKLPQIPITIPAYKKAQWADTEEQLDI
ncbi:adenine-specific DNA-methyltransferase [Candidatus Magnetoovum chiemensis]|nr:adenine-specific DNA-methyltransferase [Candidatus Magnetoovum chiemensis]